jgi:hypothetical protein
MDTIKNYITSILKVIEFSHPENGGSSSSWISGKTCTTQWYRNLSRLPLWKRQFYNAVFKTDKYGKCPHHSYFASDLKPLTISRIWCYVVWFICTDGSIDSSAPFRINMFHNNGGWQHRVTTICARSCAYWTVAPQITALWSQHQTTNCCHGTCAEIRHVLWCNCTPHT